MTEVAGRSEEWGLYDCFNLLRRGVDAFAIDMVPQILHRVFKENTLFLT